MDKLAEVIMIDAPEAAQYRTGMSGWVSRSGNFFGDNLRAESLARYNGCTHVHCKYCGEPTLKSWTACDACREKKDIERYKAMPRKAWDGIAMIYSEVLDKYYSEPNSIEDALEDGVTLDSLRLVICEPNRVRYLDASYVEDGLAEDDELPDCLIDAIKAFNTAIDKSPPLSWSPGKFALDCLLFT